MFQPGAAVEAEVVEVDPRERKIALSVRSLLDSEEKAEMQQYMGSTRAGTPSSRTTLGDLINKELEGRAGKADEGGVQDKGDE